MTALLGPVDVAREVVRTGRFDAIKGQHLDRVTAGAIVAVADALNETNVARLNAMPLERAVTIAWKLVK